MHAGKGIAALVTCECLWALHSTAIIGLRPFELRFGRLTVKSLFSCLLVAMTMHACKGMPALITTHERLWALRHQSTSLLHRSTVFDRVRTAVRVSYGGIFLEYSATKQLLF